MQVSVCLSRLCAQFLTHLEPPCQEFVLHLQVVAFVHLGLEGLVEDGVAWVVLDVLPASVAVTDTRV